MPIEVPSTSLIVIGQLEICQVTILRSKLSEGYGLSHETEH